MNILGIKCFIGKNTKFNETRKHSRRMRTDRAVIRPSCEPVTMTPIVDRQTPVKTLPTLAVGNKDQVKILLDIIFSS